MRGLKEIIEANKLAAEKGYTPRGVNPVGVDKEARQRAWNKDAKDAMERRKRLNGRTAAE